MDASHVCGLSESSPIRFWPPFGRLEAHPSDVLSQRRDQHLAGAGGFFRGLSVIEYTEKQNLNYLLKQNLHATPEETTL